LISAAQRERAEFYVNAAKEEGATIACGGKRPEHMTRGFYYEPTLITNATNKMRVAREEIFGPVIVAIPFKTEEEAVSMANDSDYGLAGYVWSGDKQRAIRVARQMRTGSVQINGTPPRPDTPFGGFKQSGIGRDNGLHAINAYTEQKFIGFPPDA
jgi:acyl-CoA reductase-like NAD-dependent aldehyde dehydrogenase